MALMLRPKQIQTFQRLIANHRFLDRSQAGTGKTPTQCALTGYVMRITPKEILTLIGEKKISTRASLTNNSFLQPMSARIVIGGKYKLTGKAKNVFNSQELKVLEELNNGNVTR